MKDFIFDDGSVESKVLQFENIGNNPIIVKVPKYDRLDNWLAEILEEDDEIKRCFLHFCYEDYVVSPVDIRADIAKALHNYPNLRIVLQYEQTDRASIHRRASNYGISLSAETDKVIEENKDKIKLIEYNKEKAQGYGQYTVGGNDSIIKRADYDYTSDSFDKKREEFKDKRRRKKKDDQ